MKKGAASKFYTWQDKQYSALGLVELLGYKLPTEQMTKQANKMRYYIKTYGIEEAMKRMKKNVQVKPIPKPEKALHGTTFDKDLGLKRLTQRLIDQNMPLDEIAIKYKGASYA